MQTLDTDGPSLRGGCRLEEAAGDGVEVGIDTGTQSTVDRQTRRQDRPTRRQDRQTRRQDGHRVHTGSPTGHGARMQGTGRASEPERMFGNRGRSLGGPKRISRALASDLAASVCSFFQWYVPLAWQLDARNSRIKPAGCARMFRGGRAALFGSCCAGVCCGYRSTLRLDVCAVDPSMAVHSFASAGVSRRRGTWRGRLGRQAGLCRLRRHGQSGSRRLDRQAGKQ